MAEAPCYDCGTTKRDRSPCPLCSRVVCQLCAESDGASCCDNIPGNPERAAQSSLDRIAALVLDRRDERAKCRTEES